MKPQSSWVSFRRALGVSVAMHIAAAGALLLFLHLNQEQKPLAARIDTHVDKPQIRMEFVEEMTVGAPQPNATPQAAQTPPQLEAPAPAPAPPQTSQVTVQPTVPDKPFAPAAPQMLPSEMLALIRKNNTSHTTTNPTNHTNIIDANVKPAGSTNTNANSTNTSAPAIHGALKPAQTVVYVLDCSGSMGASGKFDRARAALVSTLKQQPATVRFQVIVYKEKASPLLKSDGRGLLATEANIREATDELAKLEARGQTNHLQAVGAALSFHPDVILILTDADDFSEPKLKRILTSAPKPVAVCVGQVTTEDVQRPRELK